MKLESVLVEKSDSSERRFALKPASIATQMDKVVSLVSAHIPQSAEAEYVPEFDIVYLNAIREVYLYSPGSNGTKASAPFASSLNIPAVPF